ncbi:MAG: FecR domain-containing protein [Anaerolineales bacterium]
MAKNNEEWVEQVVRALAQDDVRAGDAYKRHLIETLQAHQQRTPLQRFWHRLMRPLHQRWVAQWALVAAMMIVICAGVILLATPSRYIVLDVLQGQAEVTRSSPIVPWQRGRRETTTSGAAGERKLSMAQGERIQLDHESSAILSFDGSEVTLSPGTQMTITQARPRSLWQPPAVRMQVRSGEVHANVQPAPSRKGSFEVDMPAALVSVRGTVFRARVISPTHTYVATEEGVVAVTLNDPAQGYPSVEVPAGYEVDAMVGRPLVVRPVGARAPASEAQPPAALTATLDASPETPLATPHSVTVTRVPSPTEAPSPTVGATETPTATPALTGSTPTPALGADLEVDVVFDGHLIGAGQRLRYTMVVTNRGPTTAENVVVTQTLPSAMRFISATLAPDRRAPVLVWSLGSLAGDETRALAVEAHVYRWATGRFTMTAEIAAPARDGAGQNSLVHVGMEVSKAADLAVTAAAQPQQVSAGDVVTMTLRYANRGPARAEDVAVQVELARHLRFGGEVAAGAAALIPPAVHETPGTGTIIVGGSADPTWHIGALEAGAEGQIVFTATVRRKALGDLPTTIAISGRAFDERQWNNERVIKLSAVRAADLALSHTVTSGDAGAAQPGDVLTTTLRYANRGPWAAPEVAITHTLPDGVIFGGPVRASDSASDVEWTLDSQGQRLTWTTAALPADARGTLVFTATAALNAPRELVHQARIASAVWDRAPDNNETTQATEVLAPGLTLAHRARPTIGAPGMPLTYTLELRNTGALTFAPGVIQLDNLLPAGFDYLTGTTGLTLVETQRLTWTNATPVTPGQRVGLIYVLAAGEAISEGAHVGTAQATATLPAGVLTATRRAIVRVAPPAVRLSHRVTAYAVGDAGRLTVTLHVHNIGASALTEIPLADVYDPERAVLIQALPAPDEHEAGRLAWHNLTDVAGGGRNLQPGEHLSVTLAFSLTPPLALAHEVAVGPAVDLYGNRAAPLAQVAADRVEWVYLPMVVRQWDR